VFVGRACDIGREASWANRGVKRSTWPKELQTTRLEIKLFDDYLKRDKCLKGITSSYHMRNMSRLFNMIEVDTGNGFRAIESPDEASDVKLVCSILVSKLYMAIFDLPIMEFKYSWAGEILESIIAFCRWHVHEMAGKVVEGEPGHWTEYAAVVQRLLVKLEGGYRKRNQAVKDRNVIAKQQEDITRIRGLPTVQQLQAGVASGYRTLKLLGREFHGTGERLPCRAQGLANSCMVGAMWCDMFGGRKMEWETMTLEQVRAMFGEGHDWLACMEHKTSRTYGTLAKWLSPGACAALECYIKLPRPEGVASFLVPALDSTDRVDIPTALYGWSSRFLPKGCTKPTVNLMRKFFHKQLIKLTQDEASLKRTMATLDAHSIKTIDRHYALREPADDVALAKMLVGAVLGDTVPWPTDDGFELEDDLNTAIEEFDAAARADPGGFEMVQASGDVDEELECWLHGRRFGVAEPLLAICDDGWQPSSSHCQAAGEAQVGVEPAEEGEKYNAEEGDQGGKTDGKKDKKDKKDGKKDKKDKKGGATGKKDGRTGYSHDAKNAAGEATESDVGLSVPQPSASSGASCSSAGPVQPADKRRRIEHKDCNFVKAEPAPNMLVHGPPQQLKQQKLPEVYRWSKWPTEVKNHIAIKSAFYTGDMGTELGKAPPNFILHEIIKNGIANGIIPAAMTLEQARHIARTWTPPKVPSLD
jgi:hypothetical protein